MNIDYRTLAKWVLMITVVISTMGLGQATYAETEALGSWSSPITIQANGEAGIFPEIAVSDLGIIHIVYEETPDLTVGRLRYSNNASGSFTPGPVISGVFNNIELAAIDTYTVNGVDQIHVVFAGRVVGQNNLTTRLYYVYSPDNGVTWTAPVNIIGNVAGYQPDLVVDLLGKAHVAYNASASSSNLDSLAVYYVTNKSGAWSTPEKAGERTVEKSYNGFPSLTTTFIDGVVTVHLFFMGQENGGGQLGKWVFSTRKVGNSQWQAAQVRGTRSANFPDIVSFANNVYAVWEGGVAGSSGSDLDIFYVVSADNGASWSTPVIIGNNRDAQATRAAIGRAIDGSIMTVWDDQFGAIGGNTDIWQNYSPNGINWLGASALFQGPGFSLESEVAGSCENFHAVWHDSNIGGTFKVFFSQTGSTTNLNCQPPAPPVTFNLTRTSASPTTSATLTAALSNVTGSPDQIRYSVTPFQENDPNQPWLAFTNNISVNVPTQPATCGYSLYVQARNTGSSEFSAVQRVDVIIDTSIQASVGMFAMENAPSVRPDSADEATLVQPYAPDIFDPIFTRSTLMYYTISNETPGCTGLVAHTAERFTPTNPAYPYEGFVPFDGFDQTFDTNGGVGFNEQNIVATVVVTDALGNAQTVTKSWKYDDDPPIIVEGGLITVTDGFTVDSGLLSSLVFSATVTDDSYGAYIAMPDAGYWGAWVLASNSSTPPTPAQFDQYGKIYALDRGQTTLSSVVLVNDLNPATNMPGTRYVHIRFLDGAGNYSETVLTSPEINVTRAVLPSLYLPILRK